MQCMIHIAAGAVAPLQYSYATDDIPKKELRLLLKAIQLRHIIDIE